MDVSVVENLEKKFFSPHHIRPLLCWILSSVPERPGLTVPVTGQALRRAHSWRGLWADPSLPLRFLFLQVILPSPPGSSSPLLQSHPPHSFRVIFPLLRGHPSHSSRIRIGGSTLVREASQAWPKMWQAHSSHCLCYLGCSSPALERYLLVAGAPGGGLRPWSSHRLDSGPPPTLFNCGTFNTLLTDLYPSVPHLWWRCYLSYCVARRIKWVNKFHLKF